MPDQKISQLTGGGAAQATDEIPIARSGSNFKVTGANIAAAATSVGTLTSLTVSGAITGATATNTINGIVINSGDISAIGSLTLSTDLTLARDAANVLAQRRTTNAQTFRVYNTFTDASNYERGKMEWASNVLRIGTEKAGTGTARALELQTDGTTRVTVATDGLVTAGGYVLNDSSYGIRRTTAASTVITGGNSANAFIDLNSNTGTLVTTLVERAGQTARITFDDAGSTTVSAVALRNGTTPVRMNIYSTFTSTTNFERLTIAAPTGAAAIIRTNKGSGGGTARALELGTDNTTQVTLPTAGGCVIGTAALATTATDGFLYVPTCAGAPTGTPTTQTGTAPIIVDSTNNKLYFYSGGAWRDAGP